jgi:hypothetical protein
MLTAEESVYHFIEYLEEETGAPIDDKDKEWLLAKGRECFDLYYVDDRINIKLAEQADKDSLENYFQQVQESLGRMFAHIILAEYKLYLITRGLDI